MRKIPIKLRNLLERMPRMRKCELKGGPYGACGTSKLEWHHVWIYAGSQINEHWAILCVCERHHSAVKENKPVREELEARSLVYSTDEELQKYPKKDWGQIKKYYENKGYVFSLYPVDNSA